MKFKPLITIITATYNAEQVLESSIQSVISQNYEHIEYIIIDGGSTDNTINIIKEYQTKINVVISEPDNGIYDAWNKGLNVATGEWIAFLGADDVLLPGSLEAYAQFIETSNNDFNYISSKVNLVKSDDTIVRIIGKPWEWASFKRYMNVAHVGSLHHKSIYKDYGLYNTDYKITGDYELLLRAKDKLRAGFLNLPTANMRIGGVSFSSKSFIETYTAKMNSGNRNKLMAKIEMVEARLKHRIRTLFSF